MSPRRLKHRVRVSRLCRRNCSSMTLERSLCLFHQAPIGSAICTAPGVKMWASSPSDYLWDHGDFDLLTMVTVKRWTQFWHFRSGWIMTVRSRALQCHLNHDSKRVLTSFGNKQLRHKVRVREDWNAPPRHPGRILHGKRARRDSAENFRGLHPDTEASNLFSPHH